MKRFFTLLAALAMSCAAGAATYYVRTDGGTPAQCTGLTDAAYPGSGSAQPCGWAHPYHALPPGGPARIAGGDTLLIKRGAYAMGYGAPSSTACNSADRRNCYNVAPPSGSDASHRTRILGEGWDKGCLRAPTLWGTERTNAVLHMQGTSHIEVNCLEVTDHSDCAYDYGLLAGRCNKTTAPFGEYGISGIYMADGTGVVLRNLNIHGLAHTGLWMGRMTDLLVEDVRIAANAWVGLNGDLGTGINSSNSGTLTFRRLLIEWNGCLETWPAKKPYGCWAQSLGGYGDGIGFAQTAGDFTFEDSVFRYNTSDGFDLLYHTDVGSVTVTRSWSEGNAGNAFKWHGNGALTNSVAISNCAFFEGKSFTAVGGTGVDACRALGNTLAIGPAAGGTVTIQNNTVLSNGDVTIDASGGNTSTMLVRNNLFVGFENYNRRLTEPGRRTAGIYVTGALVVTQTNNLWFGTYGIGTVSPDVCPGTATVCADPLLVNASLVNPDLQLKPGSPAINAGSATGAPSTDFKRAPRPARGGVDIGAMEKQ